jgi:hypothetical protein
MAKTLVGLLLGVLLAMPVSAQETRSPNEDRPPIGSLRMDDVEAMAADPVPVAPALVTRSRSGDSLKNGAIAGLIVGGVIGAGLAIACGHPECGPLFGMSAGLGTAIGVGIDALFVRGPDGTAYRSRDKDRLMPFARGRTITAGFKKRW